MDFSKSAVEKKLFVAEEKLRVWSETMI
jgi:hypothetical protein